MTVEDRYAVLFEPVTIGPVVAKNRFYQVPHCCALGHLRPQAHAAMRGVKAEGGWAVVSTEEAEIHPTSDLSPFPEQRIWDERDIPALRLMTDAVHAHGALAAIELAHNDHHAANHLTRTPSLAPSSMTICNLYPRQARAMDKSDIRALRGWHRQAVERSIEAGFDIVYVYAGHHMTIPHHFLSRRFNRRSDEYGGSLENRVRLTRELLEDTLETVAGRCAVAFRFAVDDLVGPEGMEAAAEGREVVEMLAELPDLWDVNVAGWENDSQTSRFAPDEGYQEAYTAFVKQATNKPVVGVGRYTSPDRMAALVRRGVLDLIGAARPSIADPFLPRKIEEGRVEEICECIGCNVCVSSDCIGIPIRCTQNPTMGEEWRRGWHPERVLPRASGEAVLVVGAGPAGLECARQLGLRGYPVTLAEAGGELGGRVLLESSMKGHGAWLRVRDYREQALRRMANVEIYLESPLGAKEILEFEFPHVILATGSRWRADGVGRSRRSAVEGLEHLRVLTPDEVLGGAEIGPGPVVIYDDDQGYLAGALADHLAESRDDLAFVTPASLVSPWTAYTLEQERVQSALIEQGVALHLSQTLVSAKPGAVTAGCAFTGRPREIPCATLILVTERTPRTALQDELRALEQARPETHPTTLRAIGDCLAPGLIADAVYSGALAARDFQRDPALVERELFLREIPSLATRPVAAEPPSDPLPLQGAAGAE